MRHHVSSCHLPYIIFYSPFTLFFKHLKNSFVPLFVRLIWEMHSACSFINLNEVIASFFCSYSCCWSKGMQFVGYSEVFHRNRFTLIQVIFRWMLISLFPCYMSYAYLCHAWMSDSEVRLIIRINTMFMLNSVTKNSLLCLDLSFELFDPSTYWRCGFHVIMIRMDVRHLSSKSIAN